MTTSATSLTRLKKHTPDTTHNIHMSTKKHIQLTLTREQTLSTYDHFILEVEKKAKELIGCGYMEISDALDDLRETIDIVDAIALALEENDGKEA